MLIAGRVFALAVFVVFWGVILISMNYCKKGHAVKVKRIAGFEAIKECVGRAVEMGRPVHFSPGLYGLTLEMMAGLTALGHTARIAADYGANFVATTCVGDTYAVADAMVRQAYAAAGKSDAYNLERVRYMGTEDQFTYASAVMSMMTRDKVAANIMIGQWAAQSLLLAEAGCSIGAIQVAGAASTSQMPFFVATCDYVIIGEEIFAADAYFKGESEQVGCLRGQDVAKGITICIMLTGVVAQLLGSNAVVNLISK